MIVIANLIDNSI